MSCECRPAKPPLDLPSTHAHYCPLWEEWYAEYLKMDHDVIIRERGTDREVRRIHYGSQWTARTFGLRFFRRQYREETHVADVVECIGHTPDSASQPAPGGLKP